MKSKPILVVDDQAARALLLCAALEEADYQTSCAESAAEAMSASARERPVLAIIEARVSDQLAKAVGGMLRDRFEVPCACIADQTSDLKEIRRIASSSGALATIIRPTDFRLCIPAIDAAVACAAEIGRLRESERQLHGALAQSRSTSIAAGVLMERFRLDRDRAVGLLRESARSQRRRLADISEEVLASVERINGALRAPRG
jgi:two-component system, response regulator PdtaR